MMNDFFRCEKSIKNSFRNEPMFKNISISTMKRMFRPKDKNISMRINYAPTFPPGTFFKDIFSFKGYSYILFPLFCQFSSSLNFRYMFPMLFRMFFTIKMIFISNLIYGSAFYRTIYTRLGFIRPKRSFTLRTTFNNHIYSMT